jgi:adenine-specific DNA-methyltransferase
MAYRYIGNKTRLLPLLMPVFQSLVSPGATVADLMCGTGAVSESLRRAGYRVVASDVMTYAAHHARVRLNLDAPPPFAGLGGKPYEEVLDELEALEGVRGYIYREYSPSGDPEQGFPPRGYFSTGNSMRLDAILQRLSLWERQGRLTHDERALLRHDIVMAANRVANIAGTYGHFRSKWCNGSLSPLALEPTQFTAGYSTDHVVTQGYAEELAPRLEADLCYLDPPYMKRQYAANYHMLETLARGDEPPAIGVSGLRPWRDQYSNFCSKVRVREAFSQIIQGMDCPQFLISYSEDGLLTLDELVEHLSRFGRVEVRRLMHTRFRSNRSRLGTRITEYLFHLAKD